VSMDWKWLFIYPQLGIATVNQLVFPAKSPLSLRITSDSVMTAFFIPRLGSQIYAMAGMETRLNLLADRPGSYLGENTQYSGNGFSGMHFEVTATTPEGFDRWVEKVRRSHRVLNRTRLARLEKPSTRVPVEHFAEVTPDLFESIMAKYRAPTSAKPMSESAGVPDGNAPRKMPLSVEPQEANPEEAS
jgi:cytochrome o ubiquinol oxidase subunit 2